MIRYYKRILFTWKANCESWRMVYFAWQDWAKDLLDEYGRQPLHGCECRQFLTPDDAATRFVAPEQTQTLGDTAEGQGKSEAPGGKSSEAPGKSASHG